MEAFRLLNATRLRLVLASIRGTSTTTKRKRLRARCPRDLFFFFVSRSATVRSIWIERFINMYRLMYKIDQYFVLKWDKCDKRMLKHRNSIFFNVVGKIENLLSVVDRSRFLRKNRR